MKGLGGSCDEWHLSRTRFLELVLKHRERGGNVRSLLYEILSAISLQSSEISEPRQEEASPDSGCLRLQTLGVSKNSSLCVDSAVLRMADEDGEVFLADSGKVVWAMG